LGPLSNSSAWIVPGISRGVVGPVASGGGSCGRRRRGLCQSHGALQRDDHEREQGEDCEVRRASANRNPENHVEDDATIHLTSGSGRLRYRENTGFYAIRSEPPAANQKFFAWKRLQSRLQGVSPRSCAQWCPRGIRNHPASPRRRSSRDRAHFRAGKTLHGHDDLEFVITDLNYRRRDREKYSQETRSSGEIHRRPRDQEIVLGKLGLIRLRGHLSRAQCAEGVPCYGSPPSDPLYR
jgi:hypothetical protein